VPASTLAGATDWVRLSPVLRAAVLSAPRVHLPNRDYLLFEGRRCRWARRDTVIRPTSPCRGTCIPRNHDRLRISSALFGVVKALAIFERTDELFLFVAAFLGSVVGNQRIRNFTEGGLYSFFIRVFPAPGGCSGRWAAQADVRAFSEALEKPAAVAGPPSPPESASPFPASAGRPTSTL
jgi:hypothetical protein